MRYDNIANRLEINRLNNAIAEEEKTISGLFQRIGQTYFATHKENPEPAQAGYINAVLEAMERGRSYKEQINRVRGIAICPNPACMAEVPINSAFCNRCGARMPYAAAEPEPAFNPNPGYSVCPSCGNHCSASQRFCNRCGAVLTAPDAPPAPPTPQAYAVPAPEPPRAAEPAPTHPPAPEIEMPAAAVPEAAGHPAPAPTAGKKTCPNCGTELAADSAFCIECGTPV